MTIFVFYIPWVIRKTSGRINKQPRVVVRDLKDALEYALDSPKINQKSIKHPLENHQKNIDFPMNNYSEFLNIKSFPSY